MRIPEVPARGLTRTVPDAPTSKTTGHNGYIVPDPEPRDTGPAEAARILAKLRELDGGSGWQMDIPPPRGRTGDPYLYNGRTAVAFLYASSEGVTFSKIDVLEGPSDPAMGMTGTTVCATFPAPVYKTDPLCLIASPGLPTPERLLENLRTPPPSPVRASPGRSGVLRPPLQPGKPMSPLSSHSVQRDRTVPAGRDTSTVIS